VHEYSLCPLSELFINKTPGTPSTAIATKLSLKDRLELALILASTYLHFYSTPWMKRKLTGADIMLPRTSKGMFYPKKPFLLSTLTPRTAENRDDATSPEAPFRDLAFLLLELWFNEPRDVLEKRPSLNQASDELSKAFLLATQSAKEGGKKYKQAVMWCLEQDGESLLSEE